MMAQRYLTKLARRLAYLFDAATNTYLMEISSKLGGGVDRECPACGFVGPFKAFGDPPRYEARCPSCGALERHRLLALALTDVFQEGKSLLHFAPEDQMRNLAQRSSVIYQSADLAPGRADHVINIESIDFPPKSFDYVLVNHVLEHVDDGRALREIHRVLRPNGLLVATVPIVEGWDSTYENPDITDVAQRELHFGQSDHVRYYGRDFRDRVRAAGFSLTEFVANGEQTVRFALLPGERVFFGRSQASDDLSAPEADGND